jgi:hypothetical protein
MKIAAFTEPFGRRIKNTVEMFEPKSPPRAAGNTAGILAGYSSPVEIAGNWEQDENGVWKCKARRLWKIDGTYQSRNDVTEIDLYAPCNESKPESRFGNRVFAMFRGVWELIGFGTLIGKVTKPITTSSLQPASLDDIPGEITPLGSLIGMPCVGIGLAKTEYIPINKIVEYQITNWKSSGGEMFDFAITAPPDIGYQRIASDVPSGTSNKTTLPYFDEEDYSDSGVSKPSNPTVNGGAVPSGYTAKATNAAGSPLIYKVGRANEELVLLGGNCPSKDIS